MPTPLSSRLRLGAAALAALVGSLTADSSLAAQPRPTPPVIAYHAVRQSDWPTPLEVPLGFSVDQVADGLTSPRFMAIDRDGSLVVAEHTEGKVVRLLDTLGTGRFDSQQEIARDLTYVHSVAFLDGRLYAAAEDRIVTLSEFGADGRAGLVQTIVEHLPEGARDLYGHRTRTLLPGPDHKLYVSVGSACDVCQDDDPLRATVARMNADGSQLEVFATGLRNSVGIAFRPQAAQPELWGVDMGRNNLGPALPPDELNLIQQGLDYGWPYCYGQAQPNPEYGDADRCAATQQPQFEFPAHWSPLGLVFYAGSSFPAEYRGDALVAFHGSAADQTSDVPVGYNVARIHFVDGRPVWMQDLLRGFIIGAGHWARPVGLAVAADGSVLVSDDWSGRIFRVRYTG